MKLRLLSAITAAALLICILFSGCSLFGKYSFSPESGRVDEPAGQAPVYDGLLLKTIVDSRTYWFEPAIDAKLRTAFRLSA